MTPDPSEKKSPPTTRGETPAPEAPASEAPTTDTRIPIHVIDEAEEAPTTPLLPTTLSRGTPDPDATREQPALSEPADVAPAPPERKGIWRFLPRRAPKEPVEPEAAALPPAPEEITPIPPLPEGEELVELRGIRPPFAHVRLTFNPLTNLYSYACIEPPLSSMERETYSFVKDAFVRSLDIDFEKMDTRGAARYLTDEYAAIARRHGLRLSPVSRARIGYYLERDFIGFGAIDVLMQDAAIEDVSCDGPRLPIYIYHRKHGSMRTDLLIPSDEALDGFVMHLVQRSGKHISVAEPLVDATLPDGSRLQATLSREVTTRGSTFTIRKYRADPLTPADLIATESMSSQMMAWLWLAVEHGASGIICGGTASGKTTTLNALSLFIPHQKKIVSIEDTRELNLVHENWIPGTTRAGSMGGEVVAGRRVGEVDMFDLLKAALRQRPEFLILGEVRGQEAYVLFQAMATGHTVYSTMHADGVASAVHRLESKPIEVPRGMLATLDFVTIQGEVKVRNRRVRKMREIVEITGIDGRTGELLTNQVFSWEQGDSQFKYHGASFVLNKVAEDLHLSDDQIFAELNRRKDFLEAIMRRGIRDIATVTRHVAAYSMNPALAVAQLEAEQDGE